MSVHIERIIGEKTGRYIVTFKDGVMTSKSCQSLVDAALEPIDLIYQWDTVINGFVAKLGEASLNYLQNDPDVESISEEGMVYACGTVTQADAPWGLARLSSDSKLTGNARELTFSYSYDGSPGSEVDIYILDTGVRVTHEDFGGRARWAAVFGGHEWQDNNGHGTHVAGTAAGTRFGVAKQANILSVKVLGDNGSGPTGDIIRGLDYIFVQYRDHGRRPTVVNMSWGGAASRLLDLAVQKLISEGIHVVVAAGSEARDARNRSPARVEEAITVGSSDFLDARMAGSNFGDVVNLYAPGYEITSCGYNDDTEVAVSGGTSSAAAHVTGLVANILKLHGNISPADMQKKLEDLALKDVLADIGN
ncbi:hypothetical protein MD484_g1584, partial [Candolleomyces efflorescens]